MDMIADWASKAAVVVPVTQTRCSYRARAESAKSVCLGCPVRTECLADALDNRVEFWCLGWND